MEDFCDRWWVKGSYRGKILQTETCKEAQVFSFFSVSYTILDLEKTHVRQMLNQMVQTKNKGSPTFKPQYYCLKKNSCKIQGPEKDV